MYKCMYYSFGTEFEQNLYKFPAPWQEIVNNTSTFMYFILTTMDNPPDHLALLNALNEQINKEWDEELLPSIMCSIYASIVVLLDDLVDENPQQHRELMEIKKSLRLYTRRPRGPRQHDNTASTTMKLITASIGTSSVPFPSSLATSLRTFSGSAGSDSSS